MSAGEHKMNCSEAGPLLVFLACGELTAEERTNVETHLDGCAECRALLAEEAAFQECVLAVPQTADELDRSGAMLAQCRSELAESLDEMAVPGEAERWRPFEFAQRSMALRPGWSAVGLLAAGAILGVQLLQWLPTDNSNLTGKAMTVSAAPRVSDDQLAKMAVSEINFAPSTDAAPGTFQVQLRAEQPLVLSGNADDADMRRVLTYVLRNSERFDAGVRLDCLEALKSRIHDGEIRAALLDAVRHDQNPAVRMKALEALRDVAGNEEVRDVLLQSLDRDANPGVRVEAVNLLVRSLELESSSRMVDEPPEPPDSDRPIMAPNAPAVLLGSAGPSVQRVVRALEDLQRHDPNRYVRLRSAAALRQIGPPDVQ
jgi:HEAT repeats/Putative zinc-finger